MLHSQAGKRWVLGRKSSQPPVEIDIKFDVLGARLLMKFEVLEPQTPAMHFPYIMFGADSLLPFAQFPLNSK